MWIVTCEMVRGVLEYYVEHKETGERTYKQISEITGFTLDIINKYLPVLKDDERLVKKTW